MINVRRQRWKTEKRVDIFRVMSYELGVMSWGVSVSVEARTPSHPEPTPMLQLPPTRDASGGHA